jgi:excisionase family DNA binding protein
MRTRIQEVKMAILLSVPQVAERLGVTASCIRRWVFELKITTVKLGRLIRVPASELDRLVDAGLRPARPAR